MVSKVHDAYYSLWYVPCKMASNLVVQSSGRPEVLGVVWGLPDSGRLVVVVGRVGGGVAGCELPPEMYVVIIVICKWSTFVIWILQIKKKL